MCSARPVVGLIGDRIPHHRVLMYSVCAVLAGSMTAVSYTLPNFTSLIAYCCCVGLTAG